MGSFTSVPGPCNCSGAAAEELLAASLSDDARRAVELRTRDPIDARLSRRLLLADAAHSRERLDVLGPFELADDSQHSWRPCMFGKSIQGTANIAPGSGASYSVTQEVLWNIKLKASHVPERLLRAGVFAPSSNRDSDGDAAFQLTESPQYPVTLDPDIKPLCNIPREATQFSFIYPVAHGVLDSAAVAAALAGPDGKAVAADLELLTIGGFAYWQGKTAFPALAVRPLRLAAKGLSFTLPRDLGLLDGTGKLPHLLAWHDVTLEPLRSRGVRSFTWINPSRPDLLRHLNYFHVRADEDMALPPPGNRIALDNVHLLAGDGSARPLPQSEKDLQVEDERGTRAAPQVLHALSRHNLRHSRNAHFYQFAEHGAFAYKMDDGRVRYFDVVDSFVRPEVGDLASNARLRQNVDYQMACESVATTAAACRGLLGGGAASPAEWPPGALQWKQLADALAAVDAYERVLMEYFAKEKVAAAKLDAKQIVQVCSARRDEVMRLEDLLAPRPAPKLGELGPIGLRSCGWTHEHLELLFDRGSSGELPAAAVSRIEALVQSSTEMAVRVKGLPSCLSSGELGLSSEVSTLETCLSPLSLVTLPVLSRTKADIPLSATHFAFLYPVDTPCVAAAKGSECYSEAEHGNDLSLLVMGGFIYLDERGRIVDDGIKTLKFGVEGLRFSVVRDLKAFMAASQGLAAARGERIPTKSLEGLEQEDRWHRVTSPVLRQMSVTDFRWVAPLRSAQPQLHREEVRLADPSSGAPYVLHEHGCFMYRCLDGGARRTIYFDVLPDPSAALYAHLEQLEGFRGIAQLVAGLKRRLLGLRDGAVPLPVSSRSLALCISEASGKSLHAVHRMLADYIRAIANMQAEKCPVCMEPYGLDRPRMSFRVCKHTACAACGSKLTRCPLCNVQRPPPKLAEAWQQLIDKPDELVDCLIAHDINIADLWWQVESTAGSH